MSVYSDMLDTLVEELGVALGVPVTRDPSLVAGLTATGGCVLVGFPTQVQRLMDGPVLDVPVSLIAPSPSDLRAVDWLLDHMDALAVACSAGTTVARPIDVGDLTYPSVTVTARIAL